MAAARQNPSLQQPRHRPQAQQAGAARSSVDRDKAADHRHRRRHDRPHAGDDARRPPGHALQAERQAVRRDRAGRRRRPRATPATSTAIFVRGARRARWCRSPTWSRSSETVAPKELNHFNKLRSATITATPGARLHAGRGARLPAGRGAEAAGRPSSTTCPARAASSATSTGGLYVTFVLALVFIYLVLAAQFESFIDPFIIMLTVPLSMTGALAGAQAHRRHAQRLQPDRPGDPGRPDHQARHPDRRVRQPAAGAGQGQARGGGRGRRRCACARS